MVIATVLILSVGVVVILFSAIVGTGLARLLYLGARSCANRVLPYFVLVYQPIVVGPKGTRN